MTSFGNPARPHAPKPAPAGAQLTAWREEIARALKPLPLADQLIAAHRYCIAAGGCWVDPGRAPRFCEFALGGTSSGPCHTMEEAVNVWIMAVLRDAGYEAGPPDT